MCRLSVTQAHFLTEQRFLMRLLESTYFKLKSFKLDSLDEASSELNEDCFQESVYFVQLAIFLTVLRITNLLVNDY